MPIHLEFGPATILVTDVDSGKPLNLISLWQVSFSDPTDITRQFSTAEYIPAFEQHIVNVHYGGNRDQWDVRDIDDGTTYPTTADLISDIKDAIDALGGGGGGSVNDVTATYPLLSSGGSTPDISADTSTGGNGAADDGKIAIYDTQGQLYGSTDSVSAGVSGTATGTGYGVMGTANSGNAGNFTAVSGDGVVGSSNSGSGVAAFTSSGSVPALAVKTFGAGLIARFYDSTNVGMLVGNDASLSWTSATGAGTTTQNLRAATTSLRGTVELATDGENAASVAVQGNDGRLNNTDLTDDRVLVGQGNKVPEASSVTLNSSGDIGAVRDLSMTGGISHPVVEKTADYTLTDHDYTVYVTGASAVIITLPAAPIDGRIYNIKMLGSNTCTIARNGKTIDLVAADVTFSTPDSKMVQYASANNTWLIL